MDFLRFNPVGSVAGLESSIKRRRARADYPPRGHAALESPDGKYVYYAKNELAEPEIWQVRADGTGEKPLPLVRPGTWASWQVVANGILFVGPSLGHQAVLSLYDFAKQRTTTVKVLDRVPFWLGATADGRTVAFDQPGQEQSQTMLVDNFR